MPIRDDHHYLMGEPPTYPPIGYVTKTPNGQWEAVRAAGNDAPDSRGIFDRLEDAVLAVSGGQPCSAWWSDDGDRHVTLAVRTCDRCRSATEPTLAIAVMAVNGLGIWPADVAADRTGLELCNHCIEDLVSWVRQTRRPQADGS